MIFLKLTCGLFLAVAIKCSIMLNSVNQRGFHVSEYCPEMKHCPEASHVLCLHYDPVNVMGPNCGNGSNLTITPGFIEAHLILINEMRARVAQGIEVGMNDEPLPRGYGMMRVKWDNELAAFAQIWANRCILRNDFCRATKRFSRPSQLVGIVRFTYPNWHTILENPARQDAENVVTERKMVYAMTTVVKYAFKSKAKVTKEMILQAPPYENADNVKSPAASYLDIVSTSTTHVGCGISAYTTYYGLNTQPQVLVNLLEVVCNFAGRITTGQKVYETEPPTEKGWTVKCGCPPGFEEDKDCLCVEAKSIKKLKLSLGDKDPNSEPSVLLLPIITVEDAPAEQLYPVTSSMFSKRNDIFSVARKDYMRSSNDKYKKLLNLLHEVEQRVKYNKINGDVKEIFNAKIRQMYESIISGPNHLLKNKRIKIIEELLNSIEKINTINSKFEFKENDIVPWNFQDDVQTPKFESTFNKKRNLLTLYDKPTSKQYEIKNSIFNTDDTDTNDNYYEQSKTLYVNSGKKDFETDYKYLKNNDDKNQRMDKIKKIIFYVDEIDNQLDEIRKN